jgi:acyl-CoA thioester hydrolase
MPAIYQQTFKARYHECDAYGYLKNISYLQWMQESAFAASAAVGYEFAQYDRIGQLWLVRESDIQYLRSLRYGDEVTIKTWVMDIRRFRSIRAYEMRDLQTDALVTRAKTDWVYLDAGTLRPVTIPRSMQLAFFPEGVPVNSLSRDRFPQSPLPSKGVSVLRKVVTWEDLDMMWHVNNAAYLRYMDAAEEQALGEYGWSMQRMRQQGMRLYTQQQRIEYLQPAVPGDEVAVSTWCSDVQDESALRHFHIRRAGDGVPLVHARSVWGVQDASTGAVMPLPPVFCRALAGNG